MTSMKSGSYGDENNNHNSDTKLTTHRQDVASSRILPVNDEIVDKKSVSFNYNNDDDNDDDDEYCELTDAFGQKAYECISGCEPATESKSASFRWIRMEKNGGDGIVESLTTWHDVVEQIHAAKMKQLQFGNNVDLYQRRWIPALSDQNHLLYQKEMVNGAGIHKGCHEGNGDAWNGHLFSVLQFNALAEGLSAGPDSKAPFANKDDQERRDKNNGYGGFTEIPFPHATLDFATRRWRLLEVLVGGGMLSHHLSESPFDIIAMQEVDRFRGFFFPILNRIYGFDGIFAPKTRSPCVRMGWYSDGCALFWKRSKFQLLWEKRLEFMVGNQVLILAALRHLASHKNLLVAVTHLKAQKSEANQKIRAAQVKELLGEIRKQMVPSLLLPVIIAGDFNAEPTEPAIQQILQNNNNNHWRNSMLSFQSAYPLDEQDSCCYTTWKIRGPKTHKRVIDYIFHNNKTLECVATLSIPKEDDLEPTKLPGLCYPSDHLAIAATFKLY